MDTLQGVTEVQTIPATEDKYKVVSPETMQETLISDSEDEGGKHLSYLYPCLDCSYELIYDYLEESKSFYEYLWFKIWILPVIFYYVEYLKDSKLSMGLNIWK